MNAKFDVQKMNWKFLARFEEQSPELVIDVFLHEFAYYHTHTSNKIICSLKGGGHDESVEYFENIVHFSLLVCSELVVKTCVYKSLRAIFNAKDDVLSMKTSVHFAHLEYSL